MAPVRKPATPILPDPARIGQELHDGIGQEVTGLALLAEELARAMARTCPAHAADATRLAVGLGRVLEEVRDLARGLLPHVPARQLTAALNDLASQTSVQAGMQCVFRGDKAVRIGDDSQATDLYRIAQEAVANALRHGRARHIVLALGRRQGRLTLSVEDDGAGLGAGPSAPAGMGLRSMRERAERIGADLTVTATDQGGTLLTCTLREGTDHGGEADRGRGGRPQDPDRR